MLTTRWNCAGAEGICIGRRERVDGKAALKICTKSPILRRPRKENMDSQKRRSPRKNGDSTLSGARSPCFCAAHPPKGAVLCSRSLTRSASSARDNQMDLGARCVQQIKKYLCATCNKAPPTAAKKNALLAIWEPAAGGEKTSKMRRNAVLMMKFQLSWILICIADDYPTMPHKKLNDSSQRAPDGEWQEKLGYHFSSLTRGVDKFWPRRAKNFQFMTIGDEVVLR